MEDKNDSKESSSAKESFPENFDWVFNQGFPKKLKRYYTQFPLKSWKKIIFSENLQIRDEGLYYQGTVNKVLRNDIFKEFDFHEEKNGALDFNFKENYKIDYAQLSKKTISPDFYVYKIKYEKFFKLVKSREYMMVLKNESNIPTNINFISILGEIKSSYLYCHIDDVQRKDYEKFIDLVNQINTDEYIILMYIYDNSFKFFRKDIDIYNNDEKKSPIIYSYIPKLYYEDCYRGYNELIGQLNIKAEKIDLNDKTKFKKKRKELENDIESLKEEIKLLRKQINSSKMGNLIIISFILVLIISFYYIEFIK